MTGYTPLFSSIITSTIWLENDQTLRVWVTMMAIQDENGFIDASIPGLAATARVSLQDCETAINKFLSPDPYSRTKDHEGRRIRKVDAGWLMLNYHLYKKKVKSRAEYYRNRRIKLAEQAQQLRNTAQHSATPDDTAPQKITPPTVPPTVPPTSTCTSKGGSVSSAKSDVALPQAAATSLPEGVHFTQEIEKATRGPADLLDDLLLVFDPQDHWIVRTYLVQCILTREQAKHFDACGKLPDTKQMRSVLSELMMIRHGRATHDGKSLPPTSYARLLEIIYAAAVKSRERRKSNGFLKVGILNDWGLSIPRPDIATGQEKAPLASKSEPSESDENDERSDLITLAQIARVNRLCHDKHIPQELVNRWARKEFGAGSFLDVLVEDANKIVHRLEQEQVWTKGDVRTFLGGKPALQRPISEFLTRLDALKSLGVSEEVIDGLFDHGSLFQKNLRCLRLEQALTLTAAEISVLRSKSVLGAFSRLRKRMRSPPVKPKGEDEQLSKERKELSDSVR